MSDRPQYTIKTIEDISDIVNSKNVELFKKDFCIWLDYVVYTKDITNALGLPPASVKMSEYGWNDDGEVGVRKINIELAKKKEPKMKNNSPSPLSSILHLIYDTGLADGHFGINRQRGESVIQQAEQAFREAIERCCDPYGDGWDDPVSVNPDDFNQSPEENREMAFRHDVSARVYLDTRRLIKGELLRELGLEEKQ